MDILKKYVKRMIFYSNKDSMTEDFETFKDLDSKSTEQYFKVDGQNTIMK